MPEDKINIKQIENTAPQKRFWRRQFQKDSTAKQRRFDWIFGVIMPVVCFVADPLVFKSILTKGAMFGEFKPFFYLLNFVLVMTFSAWLIWGKNFTWLNPFLTGLFAVGGFASLVIAVVLLPLSSIGLFFIVGILGLTPFFTSFAYLRNSFRTFCAAKMFLKNSVLISSIIFSMAVSFTLPMLLNVKIKNAIDEMRSGNTTTIYRNANRLKYVAPLVNFDKLAGNYCSLEESENQKALADVYQQFTGESIERINWHICNDW